MKRAIKLVVSCIVVVVASVVLFYLWAQQPNYDRVAYKVLSVNPNVELSHFGDSTFTVMTYNLGYLSGMTNNEPVKKKCHLFADNLKRTQQLLSDLKPDIIGFQEIDYASNRSCGVDQERELSKSDYPYVARAVNWDKKYLPFPYWPVQVHFKKIFSGQSILSKFPLSNYRVDTLDRIDAKPFYYKAFYLERLAQISTATIGGRAVVVINVHLEAFDALTRLKHTKRILQLYNRYKEAYPVLLIGDFNSSLSDQDAELQLLVRQAGPHLKTAAVGDSFANTFSSVNPTQRIDYIFYNDDHLELLEGRVVENAGDMSDHLPVLARFKFKS